LTAAHEAGRAIKFSAYTACLIIVKDSTHLTSPKTSQRLANTVADQDFQKLKVVDVMAEMLGSSFCPAPKSRDQVSGFAKYLYAEKSSLRSHTNKRQAEPQIPDLYQGRITNQVGFGTKTRFSSSQYQKERGFATFHYDKTYRNKIDINTYSFGYAQVSSPLFLETSGGETRSWIADQSPDHRSSWLVWENSARSSS